MQSTGMRERLHLRYSQASVIEQVITVCMVHGEEVRQQYSSSSATKHCIRYSRIYPVPAGQPDSQSRNLQGQPDQLYRGKALQIRAAKPVLTFLSQLPDIHHHHITLYFSNPKLDSMAFSDETKDRFNAVIG